MNRIAVALLLLLTGCGASQAQPTACVPQSQAALLSAFSDNAGPGSITPQNMRNFICSTVNQNSFIGVSNAAFANSGVFTDTQMNQPFTYDVNGINFLSEYQAAQGAHFTTDALAAGIAVPSTATVWGSNAVAGYANSASSTTNTVAGYFQFRALANSVKGWGINPWMSDGGFSANIQNEFDILSTNIATLVAGSSVVGTLSAGVHANAYGFVVQSHGGQFEWSFNSQDGAAATGLELGALAATANSNGQPIVLDARDGGAVERSCNVQAISLASGANMAFACNTGNIVFSSPAQLTQSTPSSSAAACTTGQIAADTGYLYECVSTNTWKRAALSSF